jgi:Cytochrome c7 and related cytochrome c
MYKLPILVVLLILLGFELKAQSPHGKGFAMDCAQCHDSGSWSLSSKNKFLHATTGFELEGRHKNIDCKSCHAKLDFKKNTSSCVSCHTDVHNQTVGNDCARCHTSKSWIVENITKIHEKTSFPLVGVHSSIDCNKCHKTSTNVRFVPIGLECIDCHKKDFNAAKNPNHTKLKLSNDCASCHTATPQWSTRIFPNHDTFYPLTGAHAAIAKDCEKCHIGGNFTNTPSECIGCHKLDFNKTINPNHSKLNLSTDCASCHSTSPGWKPASFAIHDEFFALTGSHKIIEKNCVACHKAGNFNNTPNDCNSCHANDFKQSKDPNHITLNFSTDCASCHSTSPNWAPAKFSDHNNFFPLTGAHTTLKCSECHIGGNFKNTPKDCNSCHKTNFLATKNPSHTLLKFSTDCATCHTTNSGWSPATFTEHNAFYPLTGAHSTVKCTECHIGGKYSKTPKDCNSCHNNAFVGAKSPDHLTMGLSSDCASCHTTSRGWKPSTFNHNTVWPLTGAHSVIAKNCVQCHNTNNIKTASKDCNSCHNIVYAASKNPDHVTMGLSTDCASCHTTNSGWKPTTFNHTAIWPLTGVHAIANCNACHKGINAKKPSTDCNSCHNGAYTGAKNPDHAVMGLSTDCVTCHSTAPGWRPTTFNHNKYWLLTGAHTAVSTSCNSCHKGSNPKKPSTDCNSCHNGAYISSKNPSHSAIQLSTDCASCHTTNAGWRPTSFNHNTIWPLTGAHAGLGNNCVACHKGANAKKPSTDCNSCHNGAYTGAKNPDHAVMGLSTDCASCHSTAPGWRPTTFNHNTFWPLTGAHTAVSTSCNACHKGANPKKPSTDCNSCHNGAYIGSRNPSHAAIQLSTDCASCHTTNAGWRPTSFNHNTIWPLTGAHAGLGNNCVACHKGANAKKPSNDCNSCHNGAYTGAKNPDHAVMGLSTDCASCHSTAPGWRPTTFNHNTFWPLTGAHAAVSTSCNACHKGANPKKPSTDCNSCHNGAYIGSRNPSHAAIQLSTDCASCHTTNAGWRPTSFTHNTIWPLTGAHAGLGNNCVACHKGANAKKPSTDCNSCHNGAYTGAKNPDHAVMGLSTDCASCHSTAPGWRPTTFNHNAFWQLTGAHAAVSTSCNACHKGANPKKPSTDCNSCHNGAYIGSRNPSHTAIQLSTDCASCHTTNPGWRPTSFNHNTIWPLTGAHAALGNNCVACHKGANAKKPSNDCNSCHNGAYLGSSSPNHSAIGLSTDCASCHSTNSGWKPTTFNHNNFWVLTGAHASVRNSCNACHKGANPRKPSTDCNSCHNTAYNNATNPNHAAIGMSTDCASCHSTASGWRPTTFNHNAYWALTGAHVGKSCTQCHKGTNPKNPPTDCNSCHNIAYNNATNPNHAVIGMSTDCASCHSTNPGWRPTTFNHNAYWTLTGAHIGTNCTSCHKGANPRKPPTDCNSCHGTAYNNAANPNHASIAMSRDCASCHSTNPGWRPSTFNHNNYYPLVGAHARVASNCVLCHAGGNHSRNTCYSCHTTNYNNASPNHAASRFPTSCTDCHSQNAWRPSTWNHDTQHFPIYSGKHKGKWNNCTDCHNNAGNYAIFNCLTCHKKPEMDDKHKGKNGYSYDSISCLNCHPRGSK